MLGKAPSSHGVHTRRRHGIDYLADVSHYPCVFGKMAIFEDFILVKDELYYMFNFHLILV